MTQVTSGYEQNSFSSLKSRGLPRASNLCCPKFAELHCVLEPQKNSKVELLLLQGKKHDIHLLGKLSPYFRSCVSQELLKTKLSTNEKLPSLCYSCNRTLDQRLEKTISFNRIKLKKRAFPTLKDNKDEETVEQLTPWKYNKEHYASRTETNCTPFQRFEKAHSFMQFNKQCIDRSPPRILPEVIKITPQKKKTPESKGKRMYNVGLAPPPTPIVRYIRDLTPELRNLFVIKTA